MLLQKILIRYDISDSVWRALESHLSGVKANGEE